eukprot:scaffold1027_cov108-Cylindrotheca_fusiformis.AAC.5
MERFSVHQANPQCAEMDSIKDDSSTTNTITPKSTTTETMMVSCIRMNNEGLDHLIQGRLHEARSSFFQASDLHQHASHLPAYDPDAHEFKINWIHVQSSQVESTVTSHEMRRTIDCTFMYGMRIGDEIDDSSSFSNVDNEFSSANIAILRTTRIDWAIKYNLGLVAQLLGIVTITKMAGMLFRAESFDRYEKLSLDVIAWYDGYAPLDAALLMMALHNNQGSIYYQMKVEYQVESYWGRIQRIMGASRCLQEHSICETFRKNLKHRLMVARLPAPAA